MGKWLNYVAFLAATKEKDKEKNNDEFFKLKAKILVELESSVFSAKTGDALIAQTVTRAGRLSNLDAPEAAALFMEKTCSGDLKLDQAKNLLIAFSRLKTRKRSLLLFLLQIKMTVKKKIIVTYNKMESSWK